MKVVIYIGIVIGLGLIVYNVTKLDFKNVFVGDSTVAAIGVMAAACAVLLMVLLKISLAIKNRKK